MAHETTLQNKSCFRQKFYLLLKSYLNDRYFYVSINENESKHYPIKAGVPQGSVLVPVLCQLFTADLPCSENVITASYADDTEILASHDNPINATKSLHIWTKLLHGPRNGRSA